MARAFDQGTAGDPFDSKCNKSRTGSDDVSDGILCSDLVEADRFGGNSMNASLCDGDSEEDGQGPPLHLGIERTLFQQGNDLRVIPTMDVCRRALKQRRVLWLLLPLRTSVF